MELPPPRPTIESISQRRGEYAARLDHGGGRIRLEIVKPENLHAAGFERTGRLMNVAGVDHAFVGHQQAARAAQLAGNFTQARELAGAEQDTGAGTKIERGHWEGARSQEPGARIRTRTILF